MHFKPKSIFIFCIHGTITVSKIFAKDITSTTPAPFTSPPITSTQVKFSPESDYRCGLTEYEARTNCGKVCTISNDCDSNEYCWETFPNKCYVSELTLNNPEDTFEPSVIPSKSPISPLILAPVTLRTITSVLNNNSITLSPVTTSAPITAAPFVTSAPVAPIVPLSSISESPPKSDSRCGINEEDSRTNCGKVCIFSSDCDRHKREYCWSTFPNKCYINDDPPTSQGDHFPIPADQAPKSDLRCGITEADARGNCKKECYSNIDCKSDEYCYATLPNYCYARLDRSN